MESMLTKPTFEDMKLSLLTNDSRAQHIWCKCPPVSTFSSSFKGYRKDPVHFASQHKDEMASHNRSGRPVAPAGSASAYSRPPRPPPSPPGDDSSDFTLPPIRNLIGIADGPHPPGKPFRTTRDIVTVSSLPSNAEASSSQSSLRTSGGRREVLPERPARQSTSEQTTMVGQRGLPLTPPMRHGVSTNGSHHAITTSPAQSTNWVTSQVSLPASAGFRYRGSTDTYSAVSRRIS